MEAIEAGLQRIEARMRVESMNWLNRTQETVSNTDYLKREILTLTGIVVHTQDDLIRAGALVTRQLSGQRRMAQSCHPRYDANRHILLKSTLDGIHLEIRQADPAFRNSTQSSGLAAKTPKPDPVNKK